MTATARAESKTCLRLLNADNTFRRNGFIGNQNPIAPAFVGVQKLKTCFRSVQKYRLQTIRNLFPLCCHEERGAEPVGALLFGVADCTTHLRGVIRSQADRKYFSQGVLFCNAWPAHFFRFFRHELLTVLNFSFTNSQAQSTEAKPFQQSARTSLERLAVQRHPASTGAGKERLAVKVETHQGASSASKLRSLKIEASGDFWRGNVKPKIRLCGHWLETAGFKPGNRVEVVSEQPGKLTLRFVERAVEDVV